MASPSTTAIADSNGWIRRLMNAFGTPNASTNVEVCGWGRGFATRYTYGVGSVATGRRRRHGGHRQQRLPDSLGL